MPYRETSPGHPVVVAGIAGTLIAYSIATGRQLWRAEFDLAGGDVDFAFHAGRIYAVAAGTTFACIDENTGDVVWKVDTFVAGRATILVEPPYVILARHGEIECFDLDGRSVWRDRLKGLGLGSIALGVPGHVRPSV